MAKRKRHGNAGRRKTQATGAARRGATPADAAVVATNQDNSIMDQNEDEEDESRGMLHEEDGENSVMLDNGCTNNSESLIIEQPDDYALNSGMSMEASSSSIRLDESMASMEQDNSNSTMSNNTGPTFQCSACKEVYSTQRAAQSHIIKAHYGLARINDNTGREFTKQEMRTAYNRAVKVLKQLRCQKCGASYSSGLGYMMHAETCGKAPEDLLTTCEICGKKLRPSSLPFHKRIHEREQQQMAEKSEVSTAPSSVPEVQPQGRVKRQSAIRAEKIIQEATSEGPIGGRPAPPVVPQPEAQFHMDGHEDEDFRELNGGRLDMSDESDGEGEMDRSEVEERKRELALQQRRDSNFVESKRKEIMNNWSKYWSGPRDQLRDIKSSPPLTSLVKTSAGEYRCPNDGCTAKFSTRQGFQYHFKRCGVNIEWICLICGEKPGGNRSLLFKHLLQTHMDTLPPIPEHLRQYLPTYNTHKEPQPRRDSRPRSSTPFVKGIERPPDILDEAIKLQKTRFKGRRFVELMPRSSSWMKLKEEDYQVYIPHARNSIAFKHIYTAEGCEDFIPPDDLNLPLFGSVIAYTENISFFTGGPTWAADWLPLPPGLESQEEYFAVATCQAMDATHFMNDTDSESGLIQLWRATNLTPKFNKKAVLKMCLGIAHSFGAIWDMKWCPLGGTYDSLPGVLPTPPKPGDAPQILPRLGLLALACGDSKVRVLSIPHPCSLIEGGLNSREVQIFMNSPVAILEPPTPGPAIGRDKLTASLCLDWVETHGQAFIAAGYGSGIVAIWDLSSRSKLLVIDQNPDEIILRPLYSWQAHGAAVRSVKFGPLEKKLFLATGGMDRTSKVWDVDNPKAPFICSKKSFVTRTDWPVDKCGLIIASDECLQLCLKNYTEMKEFDLSFERLTKLASHRACTWDIAFSDLLHVDISVDAAGEAVVHIPSLGRNKVTSKDSDKRKRFYDKLPLYKVAPQFLLENDENRNARSRISNSYRDDAELSDEDAEAAEEGDVSQSFIPANKDHIDFNIDRNQPPLRLYEEYAERCRLLFYDVNFTDSANVPKKELDRICYADRMQYPRPTDFPMTSITKVVWSPNIRSRTWVLTGMQCGICRLTCLSFLADRKKLPTAPTISASPSS